MKYKRRSKEVSHDVGTIDDKWVNATTRVTAYGNRIYLHTGVRIVKTHIVYSNKI